MQETLNIAALQADLIWEQPERNRLTFQEKIGKLSSEIDLVILPEMFSTGFTMEPKLVAEKMDGTTVQWMQEMASTYEFAIVGSLVIEENEQYFNRAIFVHPNGALEIYDKRHCFSLAGEHENYTAGTEKLIVAYKGWKICPLICYDLRFPVWSRFDEEYDVLIYMANWPKPRILAWDALLKARAIENMSYCIGVNRVGKDANDYEYIGHTSVFDFLGKEIGRTQEGEEDIVECVLTKSELYKTRKKLNFLNDRDSFEIRL
jgi:predicted amidohydrolase